MLDQLLDQGNKWIDKEGVEHEIADMDGRYALNVYNWLKDRAETIGFRYELNLISTGLPPVDTAAYDDVTDAIEREQERIHNDAVAWLLDKPLLRALRARVAMDRIKRGVEGGPRPRAEFKRGLTPYICDGYFVVQPEAEMDLGKHAQRPGDETKVFIVQAGDYEDRGIEAVFVGNRPAAFRYQVEHDRYNTYCAPAEVIEWDDHNAGQDENAYAQIRRYREPWTQVRFKTLVDLETSEVLNDHSPDSQVVNDRDPQIETTKEPEGTRGKFKVYVVTTGPDYELDALRARHAHAVNTIRANVLDDITKDMP